MWYPWMDFAAFLPLTMGRNFSRESSVRILRQRVGQCIVGLWYCVRSQIVWTFQLIESVFRWRHLGCCFLGEFGATSTLLHGFLRASRVQLFRLWLDLKIQLVERAIITHRYFFLKLLISEVGKRIHLWMFQNFTLESWGCVFNPTILDPWLNFSTLRRRARCACWLMPSASWPRRPGDGWLMGCTGL